MSKRIINRNTPWWYTAYPAYHRLESIFIEIAAQKDILPMTTIEIIEYLKAMDQVEITDVYIKNNSESSLWFSIGRTTLEAKPNESIYLGEI